MILKHRDREILRFGWLEPYGAHIVSVNEAELKFLPLEMKGAVTDEALWTRLKHRMVPKHRLITLQELADILAVSKVTVSKWGGKLKEEGRIKRVGSDKTGHWEVL